MNLEWLKEEVHWAAIVKRGAKTYDAQMLHCGREPCPSCAMFAKLAWGRQQNLIITCDLFDPIKQEVSV